MPRRSAASLSVVSPDVLAEPLRPRAGVSATVAVIFHELVAQVPPKHFRKSDAALLEQYAQAIALGRQAYAELEREGAVIAGRANPWLVVLEKAHRSAVALSARLRLSPQHRSDAKVTGREPEPLGKRPLGPQAMTTRRDQVLALMRRFNRLGGLLPSEDAVRDDEDARTTARLILAEMGAVQAEIDEIVDAENESRCL